MAFGYRCYCGMRVGGRTGGNLCLPPRAQGRADVRTDHGAGYEHLLENLAMVLFGAKPHNVQAIFSLPTITVGSVALPLNVLLTIAIGLGI